MSIVPARPGLPFGKLATAQSFHDCDRMTFLSAGSDVSCRAAHSGKSSLGIYRNSPRTALTANVAESHTAHERRGTP